MYASDVLKRVLACESRAYHIQTAEKPELRITSWFPKNQKAPLNPYKNQAPSIKSRETKSHAYSGKPCTATTGTALTAVLMDVLSGLDLTQKNCTFNFTHESCTTCSMMLGGRSKSRGTSRTLARKSRSHSEHNCTPTLSFQLFNASIV